jgi:hypothetical protein
VGNTLQRDLQSVQYSSIEKDATFGKETVLLCSTTCSCDTTTTKDTTYETTSGEKDTLTTEEIKITS